MPAILIGASQHNKQIWQALKTYIMRERQRKKQEQEADEEEERLRKKREHQQKQDVMTLGETQEQIINLKNEILQLEKEKSGLFTELKKVVYEEGSKKQQFVRENSIYPETLTTYSPKNTKPTNPQLLLSTPRSNSPLYETRVTEPQMLTTEPPKRTCSPPSTSSTLYHTSYHKSPQSIPSKPPSPDLLDWIIKTTLDSKQSNYNVTAIIPHLCRMPPGPSKSTYPTGALLKTHQPVYATNVHSMRQNESAHREEKYYSQSNQSTISPLISASQRSSQSTMRDGVSNNLPVRRSSTIPCQPPPYTPAVTSDDESRIILSRLLSNNPYKPRAPKHL